MRIETLAVHAGRDVDPSTGAVTPPIHLSTTFRREADGSYRHGYVYARTGNPTRDALERCMASLEGGVAGAAFASGSAATASIFQALQAGDHVIAPADAYYGTIHLLRDIFGRWGLESSLVDMTEPANVRAAVRPSTRLIWVETPSNPLLRIVDIAALASLAHEVGAACVCDNTWATPILQQPLDLGADLAMHSTTKYLGGHSDVLGGVIVARVEDGLFTRLREVQRGGGGVAAPFDCWLVLRGIRTLPLRVRTQSESALRIALFLREHPAVEAVHYPGLPKHPGHAVARRQMSLFGGTLSFQLKGGREAALRVAARTRLITQATSLGGTESLIEHRASVEGARTRTPPNLLRLSVGLEHPDDLIEDLSQALA